MQASSHERKHGFSIAEVIVSCAILGILGAVIVPSAGRYLDDKRIRDTLSTLEELAVSINAFHATVQNWPGRLSDLTTNIVAGQRTACTAVAYATPARWVIAGPYFGQTIPTTGFKLGVGVANNTLVRVPNSAAAGMLNIVIPNVTFSDARAMNDVAGGPGDADQPDRSNTTGVLRWSAPGTDDRVTVTYGIPVTRFC